MAHSLHVHRRMALWAFVMTYSFGVLTLWNLVGVGLHAWGPFRDRPRMRSDLMGALVTGVITCIGAVAWLWVGL